MVEPAGRQCGQTLPPAAMWNARCGPGVAQRAHSVSAGAHPAVPMHIYPAGHGFNCDARGSYHEPSATLARTRTMEFLAKHL